MFREIIHIDTILVDKTKKEQKRYIWVVNIDLFNYIGIVWQRNPYGYKINGDLSVASEFVLLTTTTRFNLSTHVPAIRLCLNYFYALCHISKLERSILISKF